MKKTQAVKEILKKQDITSWFQPIVNVDTTELLGWEAFTRGPVNGPCKDAPSLFDSAAQAGVLKPFDLLCLNNAALCFEQLQLKSKLFVNLTNEMLIASSGKLKEQVGALISKNRVPPSRIVLEIDERSASKNIEELLIAAHFFQEQGFEIALDNLGSTSDSQALWSELKPDYVKIDRRFIQNINGSSVKQDAVREIIAIARSIDSTIIAEGVETQAELETLKHIGIPIVQGYLIQRPQLSPLRPNLTPFLTNATDPQPIQNNSLACDLVVSKAKVSADELIKDVLKLFEEKVFLSSLAVIKNEKIIGIVHRASFLGKLSTRQRRDVLVDKPISSEMDSNFLEVDAHLRLEQVSRLVTAKARIHAEHDFIISSQHKFLGIGTAMDLLRRITQLRSEPDRHANLLTMLPGNIPLGDCVNELLNKNRDFTIVLLDLTNFKPFNNHYSHTKGDELLIIFSDLLRKHINCETDFAGHIGGDDFVIIMKDNNWQDALSSLFTEFNHKVVGFYTTEDQERGGIQSTDRFGDDRFFNFVTISAGAMTVTDEYFDSFQPLLTNIIKLKQRTKRHNKLRIAHQSKNKINLYSFVEDKFEKVISETVETD
ncbi:MAG: EAL domain-containing protein (putative c-di-GMP-specific phosphodiesterase class I) [Pseudohongiellaceae bacterium]|jgi:EAL domain-containing protein (putative c-di-GMP-specific phosphodiesterase class I)/GGDEF domain-containing protein